MNTAAGTRVHPRLKRRRLAIQRSKRRRLAITAAATTATLLSVWLALWSPLFDVRRITVAGARRVSPSEIERATHIDGDNLLLLRTADVAAEIERLPWVLTADVDRILPSTVRVRIEERAATAVVESGRGVWTLDTEGRVLAAGRAGRSLPVIGAPALDDLRAGGEVHSDAIRSVLAALGSMPKALRAKVSTAAADTPTRITMTLKDGVEVRYGAALRLEEKNDVLVGLLSRLKKTERVVGYIDVRVPSAPALGAAVADTP